MQQHITKFTLTSDDPEIIIDLRKTNRHTEHSNFNEFWDEINKLFEEYQTAFHERRSWYLSLSSLCYYHQRINRKSETKKT